MSCHLVVENWLTMPIERMYEDVELQVTGYLHQKCGLQTDLVKPAEGDSWVSVSAKTVS